MDLVKSTSNPLFPSKTSFSIFVAYISLFVSQGLLVTAYNQNKDDRNDVIIVVLMTEFVKLLTCSIFYLFKSGGSIYALFFDIYRSRGLLGLYLLPAFLYCLYNNLTYINLELFDLTTYYCLMQFKIVLTAIIYQFLFRRPLTLTQWTSLFILTFGCLIKEYGFYEKVSSQQIPSQNSQNKSAFILTNTEPTIGQKEGKNSMSNFLLMTLMLILQMFCSCFAGVYNEYLLKDSKSAQKADIILQNIFMYLDSILCNLIVYNLATSDPAHKSKQETSIKNNLVNLMTSPLVLILIFNNAISGLVASIFLKNMNSILKTFASAFELFAIALFARIIFGHKIDIHTIGALFLVSAAMIVYSRNPVSVAAPGRLSENRDGFTLLPQTDDGIDITKR